MLLVGRMDMFVFTILNRVILILCMMRKGRDSGDVRNFDSFGTGDVRM